MKKDIDLCGVGNALVDINIDISEQELAELGYTKSTMTLVEGKEQGALLKRFSDRDMSLCSGGSVANSIIGFSQLGGKGAFIGCVGDDRYGLHYKEEFGALGIEIGNPIVSGAATGTCVALNTPDAERTMRTHLGVASKLAPRHVDAERISRSKWLFLEGYLFANPGEGQAAIREAVACARRSDTKIAITFSEGFVVDQFRPFVEEVTAQADFVFANEREAATFTGGKDVKSSFETLALHVPSVAVTAGENGAYLSHNGERVHVPAFPCVPVDLTGAGDIFAGAVLYGVNNGYSNRLSARGACKLAMEVITQRGARLTSRVRTLWDDVTR
jgi:sugar/nucleoside kinase (ribokinase family)